MMAAEHLTALELAEKVDRLEATVAGLAARIILLEQRLAGELVTDQPADCLKRECSYYADYLAYGPADLVHEGFHALERKAGQHMKGCSKDWTRGPCSLCADFERRLRA